LELELVLLDRSGNLDRQENSEGLPDDVSGRPPEMVLALTAFPIGRPRDRKSMESAREIDDAIQRNDHVFEHHTSLGFEADEVFNGCAQQVRELDQHGYRRIALA